MRRSILASFLGLFAVLAVIVLAAISQEHATGRSPRRHKTRDSAAIRDSSTRRDTTDGDRPCFASHLGLPCRD